MLGRIVFAILGSVVAVALTSCGGPSGAALPHSFGSGSDGIAVRYPAGWALTTANPEHVPDPALCFDVSPAGGGVVLRLVEYLPPYLHAKDLSFYRPRPSHFDLSAFRIGDNDWSPGTDLAFREHGRVFFAGLRLPVGANTTTRRQVGQILDSLLISHRGRCRPTSGVGSHGLR
jgi:hypothetical protein